jgi:transcriptional regulator with XRE-family HTH domain
VQKYEKGTNRIGAGRLEHISQILQVTVPFFFEGAPALRPRLHYDLDYASECGIIERVRDEYP